jgi:hypothetical protein
LSISPGNILCLLSFISSKPVRFENIKKTGAPTRVTPVSYIRIESIPISGKD